MSKVARIETHRTAMVAARTEPELSLAPIAAPGERARQLFAQARSVSLEHLAALDAALAVTRELAQQVVEAGDLYEPGLQDFAGRVAEELFWRGKSLEALARRQADAVSARLARPAS